MSKLLLSIFSFMLLNVHSTFTGKNRSTCCLIIILIGAYGENNECPSLFVDVYAYHYRRLQYSTLLLFVSDLCSSIVCVQTWFVSVHYINQARSLHEHNNSCLGCGGIKMIFPWWLCEVISLDCVSWTRADCLMWLLQCASHFLKQIDFCFFWSTQNCCSKLTHAYLQPNISSFFDVNFQSRAETKVMTCRMEVARRNKSCGGPVEGNLQDSQLCEVHCRTLITMQPHTVLYKYPYWDTEMFSRFFLNLIRGWSIGPLPAHKDLFQGTTTLKLSSDQEKQDWDYTISVRLSTLGSIGEGYVHSSQVQRKSINLLVEHPCLINQKVLVGHCLRLQSVFGLRRKNCSHLSGLLISSWP